MRVFLALVFSLLVFGSCSKSVKETIEDYLDENNLVAESTADGLYYIIDEPGSDEKPDLTSNITIHYEGSFTNGEIFDSSYERGKPSEFLLGGNLIKGWKLGIPLFGKGGKGKLIIPPSLGYGSAGNSVVPGNSVLIFDIHLIDF